MGTENGLRRRVQGLSEAEFRERFGAEAQCRAALFALRWGKGWVSRPVATAAAPS